jgi:hypothetical protein
VHVRLRGIWGSGPDDLHVVGAEGTLLRWDGREWLVLPSPTRKELRAVWGRGPTEAYAIGEDGVLLRWNGARWSALASPTDALLIGLYGTQAEAVGVGLRKTIVAGR